MLGRAVDAGFVCVPYSERHPLLRNLRGEPGLTETLQRA